MLAVYKEKILQFYPLKGGLGDVFSIPIDLSTVGTASEYTAITVAILYGKGFPEVAPTSISYTS